MASNSQYVHMIMNSFDGWMFLTTRDAAEIFPKPYLPHDVEGEIIRPCSSVKGFLLFRDLRNELVRGGSNTRDVCLQD